MSRIFRLMFINQLPTICLVLTYIQTSFAVERTDEILRGHGYPVEIHTVTTGDHYELVVYRIPKSRENNDPSRNYPVLIQHCLFGTSADWVIAGRERSLPMQLVDDGYDVWLANSRGTPYSRGHKTRKVTEKAYWDFTIHHLGAFDLPAIIDFVLSKSEKQHIHHIGYSMSTATFYIMASLNDHHHKHIRSHISLAPVSRLGNSTSSFRSIAPYGRTLDYLFQKFYFGEILAESSIVRKALMYLCQNKYTQSWLCLKMVMDSSFGTDPYCFDQSLLPLIVHHFPVSTSSKLVLHMSQFMMKDTFAQYDYGPEQNKVLYESEVPPSYDITKVNVPVTLFYAKNDIMSCPKDVQKLIPQLPKLLDAIQVDHDYFNHIDFLWSTNVNEKVNVRVMETLAKTDDIDWVYIKPERTPSIIDVDSGENSGKAKLL